MEGRRGDGGEEEVGSWGKRREGDEFPITRFIGSISSCLKAAIQLPSYYTDMYSNSHGSGAFPVLRETPIADKRDDLTNQISVF